MSIFWLALSSSNLQAEGGDGPEFTKREIEALSNLPKVPLRQKRAPGELAFAIFSMGKDGQDYFYLRGGKPERIIFNTGVVRRFQFGGEEGQLVIYKRITNADGVAALKVIARLTPPSGSRDGIVLFRPNDNDGTSGLRKLRYIDLSKNTFKPNQVRLVNMTRQPLAVKLNGKPVKLESMKDIVRGHRVNAKIYPVKVGVITGKKVRMIYSNILQIEPKNRVMLMIVRDWADTSAGSPIRCMVYKDDGKVSG